MPLYSSMISLPSSRMPSMAAHFLPCGFSSMEAKTCSSREICFFSLAVMLLERGLQLRVLRRLRHLRQGGQDLLLGVVDVLQRVVKQILEGFSLRHFRTSSVEDNEEQFGLGKVPAVNRPSDKSQASQFLSWHLSCCPHIGISISR